MDSRFEAAFRESPGQQLTRFTMTLAEFRALARKQPEDPYWTARYFWRHFTIPFSWGCARLGITANQITIVSLVVGLAGGVCYCWPTALMWGLGTLLLYGWWFLDHVDGELGRYERGSLKSPTCLTGPYLDLLVHRWVQPLYHIGLGISLLRASGDWGYVLLGCLAGANFVGFARSQAESMVLAHLVGGLATLQNPAVCQLVELQSQVPNPRAAQKLGGIRRLIEWAKAIKLLLGFPGNLLLLLVILVVDGVWLGMSFPVHYGLAWSAALLYLMLQGLMALLQNLAGTWYVGNLLRRI